MTNQFRSKRNNRKYGGESSDRCIWNQNEKKYEYECPGVEAFKKAVQFIPNDNKSVYTILGHGCDLRDEIYQIKPNRRYITSVACGLEKQESADKSIINDFLYGILEWPITEKKLKKYSRFITGKVSLRSGQKDIWVTNNQTFHIHESGKQYVNNKNWCIITTGFPAGLRRLGDHVGRIHDIDDFNEDGPQPITLREYYLSHFEGSLFPRKDQVNDVLNDPNNVFNFIYQVDFDNKNYTKALVKELKDDFIELITTRFSIDYGTVMDNLTGTFINTSCRNICDLIKTDSDIKEDYLGQDEFTSYARRTVSADREIYVVPDKFASVSSTDEEIETDMKLEGDQIKYRERDAPQVVQAREDAIRNDNWDKYNDLKARLPGLFQGYPMTSKGSFGGKLSKYKKNYLKRSKVQRK